MITEDYVSYEVAKLLKEKGFDGVCRYYYPNGHTNLVSYVDCGRHDMFNNESCIAPTLQMACKWLREVHNIHIIVNPYTDKEENNWSFIFDKYAYGCWQELGIYITDSWNSYEEAVEVALKYTLENLL